MFSVSQSIEDSIESAADAVSGWLMPAVPIPVHSNAAAVSTEMIFFCLVMEVPLSKIPEPFVQFGSHGSFVADSLARLLSTFLFIIACFVQVFKNEITCTVKFVQVGSLQEQFSDKMHKLLKTHNLEIRYLWNLSNDRSGKVWYNTRDVTTL